MNKNVMVVDENTDIREHEQRWPSTAAMRRTIEMAAEGWCAAPRIVTDVPIARGLYDEDQRPTTVNPDHALPAPLPPPPLPPHLPARRSPAVALYDPRLPDLSMYDDRPGGRARGRAFYFVALGCTVVGALVGLWLGAAR